MVFYFNIGIHDKMQTINYIRDMSQRRQFNLIEKIDIFNLTVLVNRQHIIKVLNRSEKLLFLLKLRRKIQFFVTSRKAFTYRLKLHYKG